MNKKKIIIALLIAVALFFIIKKFMNKEEEATTGKKEESKPATKEEKEDTDKANAGAGKGNAVEQGATGKGSIINAAPQKAVLIGQNNTPGQTEIRINTPGIVRKKKNRNAVLGKL